MSEIKVPRHPLFVGGRLTEKQWDELAERLRMVSASAEGATTSCVITFSAGRKETPDQDESFVFCREEADRERWEATAGSTAGGLETLVWVSLRTQYQEAVL
jgi:hypothetical protein